MDYTKLITEAVVVVLGFFGSLALHKAQGYLESLKSKNQLGVVSTVTEQVVKWAEAELGGSDGKDKRDFAVKQALEILNSKGIRLDESSIIAGIEDGVTKLKEHQLNTKSIESYFTPAPMPSIPPVTVVPLATSTTASVGANATSSTTTTSTTVSQ